MSCVFRYEERIDRVETRIAARLRDQLGSARNANEMFRIFSRYNALFVRPHIRGAIREYQNQLIQRVKEDIEKLHTKFKVSYPPLLYVMADLYCYSRCNITSLLLMHYVLHVTFLLSQVPLSGPDRSAL